MAGEWLAQFNNVYQTMNYASCGAETAGAEAGSVPGQLPETRSTCPLAGLERSLQRFEGRQAGETTGRGQKICNAEYIGSGASLLK